MNCFIYCRKSTEDKSRQIQSIADQRKIMEALATSRNLNVVGIFQDEKSAGSPYQRPAFQEMMKKIHSGEADIILSWKIDRLSRNPIENGQLSWMLQQGIIKEIVTSDRSYLPQDNVLMFLMEGAMANQYLRDLSTNVKRGMQSKVEKGVYPALAPVGYLNCQKTKTIVPDPEIFPILKKLWSFLLTGQYQLMDLYRIMEKAHPIYVNRKLISFSTFHRVFHNSFYCGIFKWAGQPHLGIHKKMLTQSQYEKAQIILAKETKTRERVLAFDYKGLFRCGCCQAYITAERKTKFIHTEQKEKSFDYYRCVHRKRDIDCSEKPMAKHLIDKQLLEEIEKIHLPIQIIEFGIEQLKAERNSENKLDKSQLEHIRKEIQSARRKQKQIEENLATESDGEIRTLIKRKYEDTKIHIHKLEENIESLKKESANKNQDIIEALKVIQNAQEVVRFGSVEQKKKLLNSLGSNWSIKGKKLDYKPNFLKGAIEKTKNSEVVQKQMSETLQSMFTKGVTLDDDTVTLIWSSIREHIRNSEDSQKS